ncbi:hypothetical protein W02_00740 [Nitrospira sp. KM1]|nr:hypothetical protein [Nitrospira sp. KM1]BCA52934.1 hypothetical protein W02_00740 [Nitrospira sp. KM1]
MESVNPRHLVHVTTLIVLLALIFVLIPTLIRGSDALLLTVVP